MLRPRTRLLVPKPPGGYIENPPNDCPKGGLLQPKTSVFRDNTTSGVCKVQHMSF